MRSVRLLARVATQQPALLGSGLPAVGRKAVSTFLPSLAFAPLRASAPLARPVFSGIHPSAPAPSGFRGFAASAGSDDLAKILKSELAYENDTFTPNEDLKTVPGGYSITKDEAGDGEVTLFKKNDNEEITVVFEVNNQPDAEPDLEGDEEADLLEVKQFLVSVVKGDQAITFECSTDGDGVNIEHMTLEPKDGFDEDSTEYTGPVFFELDEEVQSKAQAYLSERYIFDLGPFIHSYLEEKEQKLYMEWLDKTSKFLES